VPFILRSPVYPTRVVARILDYLGLPSAVPAARPSRAPPFLLDADDPPVDDEIMML
jgi:hypothetical protein